MSSYGIITWQHMQAEHCQQTKRFTACQAPCSTYRATMSNGKSSATPQCTAHKGRLLGLGLPVSSSADVLASLCFWASSCSTSCIRSICRPGRMCWCRRGFDGGGSVQPGQLLRQFAACARQDLVAGQQQPGGGRAVTELLPPWQEITQRCKTHSPVCPHAGGVVRQVGGAPMVGSAQHAGLPCPEASAGTQLPALASGLVVQAPDLHTLRPHLQMRRDALAV